MEKKEKNMFIKFLWGFLYVILLMFYGIFYSIHFISNFISLKLKDWITKIEENDEK